MEPRRVPDLAQRSDADLFAEVAEGLSLIAENACRIWEAVPVLSEKRHGRSARILEFHAAEEAAKYLILLDAIRCPRKPPGRFSAQLAKFGSHLARGLYVLVSEWRPADFAEVKRGIEDASKLYYLDGPNDVDWIFRNDVLREREEALYVDLVLQDDGHRWASPKDYEDVMEGMLFSGEPGVIRLVRALHDAGFSQAQSLELVATAWRDLAISEETHYAEIRGYNLRTLELLERKDLLQADEAACAKIADYWLFPLYSLPMKPIAVDKGELRDIQGRWHPDV